MDPRIRRNSLVVSGLVALALLLTTTSAHALKRYYIDEITDYTNDNPCDIWDLNAVTASLQTALDADGWGGNRFVNDNAWPEDFEEECSSTYAPDGYDNLYSDTATLTIHSGHGSAHSLNFGSYHGGSCTVSMTDNARLGTMAGSQAAFGMYLDCEVMQESDLGTTEYQWLRQQASWQSLTYINDDEPRDFFNATATSTNADAWINQMSTGGRDAVIATTETYTTGSTGASCWAVHNSAKLKGDIYNYPRSGGPSCGGSQPLYWYCSEHLQQQ